MYTPERPINHPEYYDIDCNNCQGNGELNESECCGAAIDSDTLICSECHEHSGLAKCEECEGKGILNKKQTKWKR